MSWGKEVDYNFFHDKVTLLATQQIGVDKNSIFGDALFVDEKSGNYTVKECSSAFNIGFKNWLGKLDLVIFRNQKET